MEQVNIHNAKTHLSQLLERAGSGEEIVIAKAGRTRGSHPLRRYLISPWPCSIRSGDLQAGNVSGDSFELVQIPRDHGGADSPRGQGDQEIIHRSKPIF
ncbi:MAG: hypothetical protein MPW14_25165 (plasmid) [Candidatus Manganitrophus sp.]|nr:hypothetical protein [Candidatus Manganitrophus sp.]MDC4228142.1 hypothetical protein [Candidatus Manganitrophus sp.]WDT73608.1 MAG: hypothetical protein MPW17_21965 [Candidatus Manganitrophus sp.]WDT82905.1 MAG: hypothetical protein MPW14_25165 [Candidatus Manganitrophus sp.]